MAAQVRSALRQFLSSNRFLARIALAFLRHKACAIKTAMRVPFFAIFIHATLWLWVLLLMPALLLVTYAMLYGGILGVLVASIFALALLAVAAPWLFRWYFVCVGLMLGRQSMAQPKATDVAQSLANIEAAPTTQSH
jgi:hypothetical protein